MRVIKNPGLQFEARCNTEPERESLSRRTYDKRNFHVSLKQLRIFHAVHDCGGFTEAGECLYLSQSTISYTIAKLQSQLGVAIFKIEGRKATLTEAGRIILQRSRRVLKEALDFEVFSERLLDGFHSNVYLMIENGFPEALLTRTVQKFSSLEPDATLSMETLGMWQASAALTERPASLAICSWIPEHFIGEPFIDLDYVPVAHADHPLSKQAYPLTISDLHEHLQIVIDDLSEAPRHNIDSVKNTDNYRTVPDLFTALDALGGGVGYAWLPQYLIATDLWEGNLNILPLKEDGVYNKQFYLVRQTNLDDDAMPIRLANILKNDIARRSIKLDGEHYRMARWSLRLGDEAHRLSE